MNHIPFRDETQAAELEPSPETFAPFAPDSLHDPAVARLRAVHRAASECKRGTPVVMQGESDWVLVPAETAGARGLAEFAAIADGPPVLLLAPTRAATVLRRPLDKSAHAIAIRLPEALLSLKCLRGLADPTTEQLLPEDPQMGVAPPDAPAMLALAKLARLLPAMIAAPARAGITAESLGLLTVSAQDVLDYPNVMATRLVRVAEAKVPLEDVADARVVAFRAPDMGIEHLAILIGRPEDSEAPLVPPK